MVFVSKQLLSRNPFSLQTKSMKLYEVCLTLLQVYSKNNLGRKRLDVAAEEDQYQDLLLIMELLTNLLSKEFIDFSDTGKEHLGCVRSSQSLNRKKKVYPEVCLILFFTFNLITIVDMFECAVTWLCL